MSHRFVNSRIADVPPSAIRRFFDVAGSIENVISLGIGEPDFVTPYSSRDAMINSLLDGQTQYTANPGLLPLRQEISYYLAQRFDIHYNPENEILVTVGASEAIDIALRAVVEMGDEVLIPEPCFVSYGPCVTFAGGVPVPVPCLQEDGFQVTAQALRKHLSPRTKAILISYPNNPTGAVLDREHLEEVASVAREHDLLVLSDEIYNELTYDSNAQCSLASLPEMSQRVITINGFSKAFAMTGLRIGYVAAPADILGACAKIHQYTIMCASRQSQVAALSALRKGRQDGYADIEGMRQSYDRRRRLMYDAFTTMGLECTEPQGAFYAFPSIRSTGLSSDVFCRRLLEEQAVVCIPGNAFGAVGEGHIRCCYATGVDKLVAAFDRMQVFLDSLRRH